MFCKMCGAKIDDDWVACPKCGQTVDSLLRNNFNQPTTIQPPAHTEKTNSTSGTTVFITIAALIAISGWIFSLTADSSLHSFGESQFIINVEGSGQLPFQGAYMVINGSGQSVSQSVSGKTPATYTANGKIVSVSFQKHIEQGYLSVSISKNGKVVNSGATTAPYGVVAVASP